jgi:hypothetical protein
VSNITGGCRCGAVRYTLAVGSLPTTYACHCLDCQTWSGSAFSQQTFLPEEALAVTGPLSVYELTTPSGSVSKQRMCSICHTRVFNTNSARPGVVVIRAGTLDGSDQLDVVAHIWVKRKQPWLDLSQDVPKWPEGAPVEQLLLALARRRTDA